ncbi:Pyruvate/Phosphoenolpyruvate kinase-like domain-containing protein [Phyllosticta citribraziliensis]|uniref:Pyruvate/Phosphoenolpyruvate kinase-like domain-containing protein n=1 Tax=Phyllosticta citribraziliensis TaxID=989973 RepID=A0ABR1LZU9_9PEZI
MAAPIIRRALLYVPGSSSRMLEKSRALNVDTIAYDLEDSVTPGKKAEARSNLRKLLEQPRVKGIREQAVRINSVDSGYALDDLTEVLKAPNIDALVIPKVNSASDLHFVTDVIRHTLPHRHSSNDQSAAHPPLRLIALIESAKALIDLQSICRATPYLSGLIFAAEDFALDLSITRTPSLREFLYARSAIVTACRAFNLPSAIDLVCTAYKGEQGLQTLNEECVDGKRLGFNGKQLIHPSQVEVCQEVYGPQTDETEWAMRVVIANEKAEKAGRGAWTLDGKMIDRPVVGKAEALVKKAELCGVDVGALKDRWSTQEPE